MQPDVSARDRPGGGRRSISPWLWRGGAVAAIALAGLVAWIGEAALAVGLGYSAKALCSGVFVSGRPADGIMQEIPADGLGVLGYVRTSVDRPSRSVQARLFGFSREATYRDGLGCALVLDDLTAPALAGRELSDPDAVHIEADAVVTPGPLLEVIERAFVDDPDRPARTSAVVVLQHGRVVAERYAPGITPAMPLPGWSMAKGVMNALVGILVRQGRMRVTDRVDAPEWRTPGDGRAAITVDHLLRMSSGLTFDEGSTGATADVVRMLFSAGDVAAFAAAAPLGSPPGTSWHYSNGTTNILSRAMRHVLADDTVYLEFPRRELFDRIGMTGAVLETDASGTFVASSYLFATARDWARFGELYLHDGVWAGERILPEGWVAWSTTPAPADGTRGYGAHFWLKVTDGYDGGDPTLPVPAFHAIGREGQFVTIVPSRDVVIVRLGRTRVRGAWDHAAFVRDALLALR